MFEAIDLVCRAAENWRQIEEEAERRFYAKSEHELLYGSGDEEPQGLFASQSKSVIMLPKLVEPDSLTHKKHQP